jgi:hypothetical protein
VGSRSSPAHRAKPERRHPAAHTARSPAPGNDASRCSAGGGRPRARGAAAHLRRSAQLSQGRPRHVSSRGLSFSRAFSTMRRRRGAWRRADAAWRRAVPVAKHGGYSGESAAPASKREQRAARTSQGCSGPVGPAACVTAIRHEPGTLANWSGIVTVVRLPLPARAKSITPVQRRLGRRRGRGTFCLSSLVWCRVTSCRA